LCRCPGPFSAPSCQKYLSAFERIARSLPSVDVAETVRFFQVRRVPLSTISDPFELGDSALLFLPYLLAGRGRSTERFCVLFSMPTAVPSFLYLRGLLSYLCPAPSPPVRCPRPPPRSLATIVGTCVIFPATPHFRTPSMGGGSVATVSLGRWYPRIFLAPAFGLCCPVAFPLPLFTTFSNSYLAPPAPVLLASFHPVADLPTAAIFFFSSPLFFPVAAAYFLFPSRPPFHFPFPDPFKIAVVTFFWLWRRFVDLSGFPPLQQ